MRSRPLFVQHTPLRTARRAWHRLSARRALLLGPVVLAVAVAASGHVTGTAPIVRAEASLDLPERATPAPLAARHTVVRHIPERRPARASRSRQRTSTGWVRPAYGPLTSPFGYRWGRLHAGIDIGAPYGAPIYAAAAGVVTYVGPQAGYGRLVLIRHGDGTVTAYGHMSRYATRIGQRVSAGQLIAYVGSAGDATGPHLHFEVRVRGVAIDPRPFLRERGIRY